MKGGEKKETEINRGLFPGDNHSPTSPPWAKSKIERKAWGGGKVPARTEGATAKERR